MTHQAIGEADDYRNKDQPQKVDDSREAIIITLAPNTLRTPYPFVRCFARKRPARQAGESQDAINGEIAYNPASDAAHYSSGTDRPESIVERLVRIIFFFQAACAAITTGWYPGLGMHIRYSKPSFSVPPTGKIGFDSYMQGPGNESFYTPMTSRE